LLFKLILNKKIKIDENIYSFVTDNFEILQKDYNEQQQMDIILSIVPYIQSFEILKKIFVLFFEEQNNDNYKYMLFQKILDNKILIKTYNAVVSNKSKLVNIWKDAFVFCSLYFFNDVVNQKNIKDIQNYKKNIIDMCLKNKKYYNLNKNIINDYNNTITNIIDNVLLEKSD